MNKIKMFFFKQQINFLSNKGNVELGIVDRRQSFFKALALFGPFLTLIILFTLIPLLITLTRAFIVNYGSTYNPINGVGINNFESLFQNSLFLIGIRNSIVYGFLSVPLTLFLSLLISSAIVHILNKFFRSFFQTLFFIPYVTSSVAIAITFIQLFGQGPDNIGILNSIFGTNIEWLYGQTDGWLGFSAILISGVWNGLAFNILMLSAAMLSVDKNLYKSASIDGASTLRQFFLITIPSIKNRIIFTVTIGIIGAIRVFPLALFNNDPNNAILSGGSTIMMFIFRFITPGTFHFSAAASLFLFVLSVTIGGSMNFAIRSSLKLSTYFGEKRVSKLINHKNFFWQARLKTLP